MLKNFFSTYLLYIVIAISATVGLVMLTMILTQSSHIDNLTDDLQLSSKNVGVLTANQASCHEQVDRLNMDILAFAIDAGELERKRKIAEAEADRVVDQYEQKIALVKHEQTETVEELRIKLIRHARF